MHSLIENNKRNVNLENALDIAKKLNMKIEGIWYKEKDSMSFLFIVYKFQLTMNDEVFPKFLKLII